MDKRLGKPKANVIFLPIFLKVSSMKTSMLPFYQHRRFCQ